MSIPRLVFRLPLALGGFLCLLWIDACAPSGPCKESCLQDQRLCSGRDLVVCERVLETGCFVWNRKPCLNGRACGMRHDSLLDCLDTPDTCDPVCSAGQVCINATCQTTGGCNPACPVGQACLNGVCQTTGVCNPACPSGTLCVSGVCQPTGTCNPACPAGQTCVSGSCQPTGTCNPACPAGQTCVSGTCQPTGTCNPACPTGQTCVSGVCRAACQDACSLGQNRCEKQDVQICGKDPSTGCAAWFVLQTCAVGQTCVSGICQTTGTCNPACPAGQTCVSGTCQTTGTCNPACPAGQTCVSGTCQTTGTCNPACPAGQTCVGGLCKPTCQNACQAGQKQCASGVPQDCQADATGCLRWVSQAACPAGQTCLNGTCQASCQSPCPSGQKQCAGNTPQTCQADPTGCLVWTPQTPCAATQICEQGQCVAPTDPSQRTAAAVCARWLSDFPITTQASWTGTRGTCDPGTISEGAIQDAIRRVNLYRWLVGLPAVLENPAIRPMLQECAVLQANNGASTSGSCLPTGTCTPACATGKVCASGTCYSPGSCGAGCPTGEACVSVNAHYPPQTWKCYTQGASQGSGTSNLSWGVGHPAETVPQYMSDRGVVSLGHRLWIISGTLGRTSFGYAQGSGRYPHASCMQTLDMSGRANPDYTAFPSPGPFPIAAMSHQYGDIQDWSFTSSKYKTTGLTQVEVIRKSDNDTQTLPVNRIGGFGNASGVSFKPRFPMVGESYTVKLGTVFSYTVDFVNCP